MHTLEALYDGGRIMTRDNTEWGPFTRKFKALFGRPSMPTRLPKTNQRTRTRGILFGMNWIRNEGSAQTPSSDLRAALDSVNMPPPTPQPQNHWAPSLSLGHGGGRSLSAGGDAMLWHLELYCRNIKQTTSVMSELDTNALLLVLLRYAY